MGPFSTLPKNQQRKKESDKQQQTENTNDPISETLQNTISILRTELVNKQKTIDTLILIIEKITIDSDLKFDKHISELCNKVSKK